jgi:cytochrome b
MTEGPGDKLVVAVWDWPVRFVHWAIVALVATLLATGLAGGSAVMVWHMRAGEALLALVLFRIVWGFAGSANARFASFVRGPGAVLRYLRSLFRPPHPLHATHNPAGGWMVVALLVVLLVQCSLGLFTHDDVMTEGPLVGLVSEDLSDALGALHRRGWWLVAGLASVHILAVVAFFLVRDDNLVYPMFSGKKSLPRGTANPKGAAASTALALALFALCAFAVGWLVMRR